MEELQVINHNNVDVIDSREVAEMIGKEHRNLIRDIRGYVEIIENSTELKIEPSDFFIESNYKDSTGRTLPCYSVLSGGEFTTEYRTVKAWEFQKGLLCIEPDTMSWSWTRWATEKRRCFSL